jgi:hypothetical protein
MINLNQDIQKFNHEKKKLFDLINQKLLLNYDLPDIPLNFNNTEDILKSITESKYVLNELKKKISYNVNYNIKSTNVLKYKNQFCITDDIFWGIGLENECYLKGKPKLVLGKNIIKMLGRERYSVNYLNNYKEDDIKKIMSKVYSPNKYYNVSQMINSHSFCKTDINDEHQTTYHKNPMINNKFNGKTIYEEWANYDSEIKEKINNNAKTETNIFFDGDTIEFITEKFYKTNSSDVVNELINNKKWFIDKFNEFKIALNLWESLGEIKFVSTHPGLNIFKSMQDKIVFFNNSTIHLHITLPTNIKNGVICDNDKFNMVHSNALKLIQWFEPFFICTIGSPDILQFVYEKFYGKKENYFAKGSMRATLSRYIGVGTYNPKNLTSGKLLVENVENIRPKNVIWWRDMIKNKLLYNLPEKNIGFDFNFAKYYQSGIEFRLMDGMPIEILKDIIDVILLICEHSISYNEIEFSGESQSWNNIVFQSMINGYEAKISLEDINNFLKSLNINLKIEESELTLENFYYLVLEYLFEIYKNKDTNVLKYMTKDFNKINRWDNFNRIQSLKHLESLESIN